MQHFQLGEILKAYCHYQEAALHLRHVLELKPNYGPALAALQDMESIPNSSVHGYTVLIIIVLICVVLVWILGTLDIHISDLFWNESATNGGSASEGSNNGFKNKAARFQSKRQLFSRQSKAGLQSVSIILIRTTHISIDFTIIYILTLCYIVFIICCLHKLQNCALNNIFQHDFFWLKI